MVVRAVSPHPDPLPQGEGTTRIAQWKADGSGLFSAERRVHPLPKGEGWGEGKEPWHAAARMTSPGVQPLPAGLHVFEAFTIPSLRLCRRSLTRCQPADLILQIHDKSPRRAWLVCHNRKTADGQPAFQSNTDILLASVVDSASRLRPLRLRRRLVASGPTPRRAGGARTGWPCCRRPLRKNLERVARSECRLCPER